MINQALREHISREDRPLEDVLRRVVREERQNVRTP
jgi:hemerythrin-like domain-containing protein